MTPADNGIAECRDENSNQNLCKVNKKIIGFQVGCQTPLDHCFRIIRPDLIARFFFLKLL
jgi:hypothetical protein